MFLALVHLKALECPVCSVSLAGAGARSPVTNGVGDPMAFDSGDPPAEIVVHLRCANGHTIELNVPNEIAAEEILRAPDDAPLASDARLASGETESGKPLQP